MRVSTIVLSDEEFSAKFREERANQPADRVEADLVLALDERTKAREAAQRAYDNPKPSRRQDQ